MVVEERYALQVQDLREFLETGTISPERMRAVDLNAAALGAGQLQMMESAGKALAEMALASSPDHVLVLCGAGNNGGDGMVAARYLQHGVDTDVIYPGAGSMTCETASQLALLRRCAVALHPVRCGGDVAVLKALFDDADLIIDAMLGTGASGTLREPLKTCITYANKSQADIISADLPTPGIIPQRICAFHRPKQVDVAEAIDIKVIDIGIPLEAEVCVGPGDLTLIPHRRPDSHKGAGGEVLVVGGGPYQGAPYLAGLGALRAGADIVRIASPVFMPHPDLIVEELEGSFINSEHCEVILHLAERADVVVCGNGLGSGSHAVVMEIAPHCRRAVFDADALRLPLPVAGDTIYTPHGGEFRRITGTQPPTPLAPRGHAVKEAAENGTVLLKGAVDVISDGRRVRFNTTGSAAMTTGGTGDVLAGITAALFCRLPAFESACIAAYVNGCAGTAAAETRGEGMTASDLLEYIPCELFREGVYGGRVHACQ